MGLLQILSARPLNCLVRGMLVVLDEPAWKKRSTMTGIRSFWIGAAGLSDQPLPAAVGVGVTGHQAGTRGLSVV